MKRKPIYHKENPSYRVVSRSNGLWVAQRLTESKGTAFLDPWQDLHKPNELEHAMQVMHERCPLKQPA